MTEQSRIEAGAAARPYRFTQRDFILLSGNGAFDDLAKAELIEGVIFAVNAQYSRHARAQTLLFRALAAACDRLEGAPTAWLEASVSVNERSLPQPDMFLAFDLPELGPVPADQIVLVVEVADSSLELDLNAKAAMYAGAGIPEYWVADVNGRLIHQMWEPAGEAYAERREVAFGEVVEAATVARLRVETGGL